jgi:DNA-binding NtrC family response regulator
MQCDGWPGNVRELRNAVERVVRLGKPPDSAAAAEPESQQEAELSFSAARQKVLDAFEKDFLIALLKRHKGKIAPAATAAGVARSQFYRLLERHGLKE